MFAIKTFFSMLFVKCSSRGEQIGVVVGMLILIAACIGIGKFLLGLGEAGAETMLEVAEMERRSRNSGGAARVTLFAYAGVAICGVTGVIFALVGLINAVRFLTGTGLADPDEGW